MAFNISCILTKGYTGINRLFGGSTRERLGTKQARKPENH